MKRFQCGSRGQVIEASQGFPKPSNCPECGAPATMIHRLDKGPLGEEEKEGLLGSALRHSVLFFDLVINFVLGVQ